jgi:hypothetical protein
MGALGRARTQGLRAEPRDHLPRARPTHVGRHGPVDPGYEQLDVNAQLAAGGLVPVASGKGHDAAIAIRQRGAVLYAGRLQPGDRVTVPDDRHVHVFVPVGSVTLDEAGQLGTGDAARLTAAGELGLAAGDSGADVLIWATA